MTRTFNGILGGLGLAAALLCILPIAESVGAAPPLGIAGQVNRGIKTDRLILPQTIAKKTSPVRTIREEQTPEAGGETGTGPGRTGKPELKDGCEPLFSPVTTPAMAHLPGRCIG
jgi:hypothetical protein